MKTFRRYDEISSGIFCEHQVLFLESLVSRICMALSNAFVLEKGLDVVVALDDTAMSAALDSE